MAKEENLRVNLIADNKKLKQGLDQGKQQLESFGNTVAKIGGIIGAAFSVQQIIRFQAEAIKLAGIAQGVRMAFERLGDPRLMMKLEEATRGTVSELQLMQMAVQASNFRIPMETLVSGLEFATRRAKETGESVDYLVQSFVTGVGRKSAMILDNLGISLVELQEEIKITGDFMTAVGAIIDREMEKAGKQIETTADHAAQLNKEWADFKLAMGEAVTSGGEVDATLKGLTVTLDFLASKERLTKVRNWAVDYAAGLSPITRTLQKIVQLMGIVQKAGAPEVEPEVKVGGGKRKLPPVPSLIMPSGLLTSWDWLEPGIKKVKDVLAGMPGIIEDIDKEIIPLNYDIVKLDIGLTDLSYTLEQAEKTFMELGEKIDPRVFKFFTDGIDIAADKYVEVLNFIADTSKMIKSTIKDVFVDLAVGIGEALGDAITGMEGFLQAMLRMISGVIKTIGRVFTLIGVGAAILGLPHGGALIAAGIGLTAIGQIGQNLAFQNSRTQTHEATVYKMDNRYIYMAAEQGRQMQGQIT